LVDLEDLLSQLGLLSEDVIGGVEGGSLSHAALNCPGKLTGYALLRTEVIIAVDASVLVVIMDAASRYVVAFDTLLGALVSLSYISDI
jgi:hypothetical protein